ncbi:MAG: 2-oxoacid:acceptor oxidoreductase family protein [Chloroflexi bacterium]|nr:2-oxoacid:acceptor oxidoreductase family protein [Chloroflexota bacterium]
MEREIIMGGIGGQGVQLATKILAHALNSENRQVMHFAAFGGTMRGGNVECTVVTGDRELLAPPMIPLAWLTIAMHESPEEIVKPKTRKGGIYVVNSSLMPKATAPAGATLFKVPASALAEKLNNVQGASMVMLGAVCRATGLVSLAALEAALKANTPSYRQQTVAENAKAFQAGDQWAAQNLKDFKSKAWAVAVA